MLVGVGTAHGQRDAYQAEDEIRRLLDDAGRSYNNLELQQANSSVSRALQLVAQFGVQSDAAAALVAQVYVLKGVISYVKDRNTAIAASEFVKALRYDDRARIDPMMSSPSLERVFNQARGQARTNRDMDRGRRDSRRDDRRDSRRNDRRNSVEMIATMIATLHHQHHGRVLAQ